LSPLFPSSFFYLHTFITCCSIVRLSFSTFLISDFRRDLNIVYFLLGISPASNFSWPTFRNPVPVPSSKAGCTVYSLHPAFEDGTDTGFRNVGQLQFDTGEIPRRKYTISLPCFLFTLHLSFISVRLLRAVAFSIFLSLPCLLFFLHIPLSPYVYYVLLHCPSFIL